MEITSIRLSGPERPTECCREIALDEITDGLFVKGRYELKFTDADIGGNDELSMIFYKEDGTLFIASDEDGRPVAADRVLGSIHEYCRISIAGESSRIDSLRVEKGLTGRETLDREDYVWRILTEVELEINSHRYEIAMLDSLDDVWIRETPGSRRLVKYSDERSTSGTGTMVMYNVYSKPYFQEK